MDEREVQREVQHEERIRLRQQKSAAGSMAFGLRFFLVALIFVLGIASTFFFLRSATGAGPLARVAALLLGRNVSFDSSAPALVERIQKLNRLETVTYSIDTVVEGRKDNAVLPDLLFGDRLLLVAHGQTIAGVDLSKLRAENVRVNGKSVTVDLPESEIFLTKLDSSKTRVYARTTGMLVPQDTTLESETRRLAEEQIQKAAIGDGILDTARANARMSITALLTGLGFDSVTMR